MSWNPSFDANKELRLYKKSCVDSKSYNPFLLFKCRTGLAERRVLKECDKIPDNEQKEICKSLVKFAIKLYKKKPGT